MYLCSLVLYIMVTNIGAFIEDTLRGSISEHDSGNALERASKLRCALIKMNSAVSIAA